jgi:hypothetical protein
MAPAAQAIWPSPLRYLVARGQQRCIRQPPTVVVMIPHTVDRTDHLVSGGLCVVR